MGAYWALTKSLFSVAEFPVSSGKIPVLILREFAGNALIFLVVGRSTSPKALPSVKISLYFPGDQGSRQGDRFADDCLHRQFPTIGRGLLAAHRERPATNRVAAASIVCFEPVSRHEIGRESGPLRARSGPDCPHRPGHLCPVTIAIRSVWLWRVLAGPPLCMSARARPAIESQDKRGALTALAS